MINNLAFSQSLRGFVLDHETKKPIEGVNIWFYGTKENVKTDSLGAFNMLAPEKCDRSLRLSKEGYFSLNHVFSFDDVVRPLKLYLKPIEKPVLKEDDPEEPLDLDHEEQMDNNYRIFLSSEQNDATSSLLKNVGIDFVPRAYFGDYNKLYINGVPFEHMDLNRINYNGYGGLNNVMRPAQATGLGGAPLTNALGGLGNNINISTRASGYRKSNKLSVSYHRGNYKYRIMFTHASTLGLKNSHFIFSTSRRWARSGPIDATFYDAWSYFLAFEQEITPQHSLNLSSWGVPMRRGLSSAFSQEIYNYKGPYYNPNWGLQDGKKRNARIKRFFEPIVMLSHYWNRANKGFLETHLSYQAGYNGITQIDRNKSVYGTISPDPNPAYYRYLPSYQTNNPQSKTWINRDLLTEPQILWKDLYELNLANTSRIENFNGSGASLMGPQARYIIGESQTRRQTWGVHSHWFYPFSDRWQLHTTLTYQQMRATYYKSVEDLLGAYFWRNQDPFYKGTDGGSYNTRVAQSIAFLGDRYQYNYRLHQNRLQLYTFLEYNAPRFDAYLALETHRINYQRIGLFQHYHYSAHSFGKSSQKTYANLSTKMGLLIKMKNQQNLGLHLSLLKVPPAISTVFPLQRTHGLPLLGSRHKSLFSFTANYQYKTEKLKAQAALYYTYTQNDAHIRRIYHYGENPKDDAFYTQIATGVSHRHMGLEAALSFKLSSAFELQSALAMGQHVYANNPLLYAGHATLDTNLYPSGYKPLGRAYIKNYKLGDLPHQAYSLGLHYESTRFLWAYLGGYVLAKNYISIYPGLRTESAFSEFSKKQQTQVRAFLKQERFDATFYLNAKMGKSWRLSSNYLRLFASLNYPISPKQIKKRGLENIRALEPTLDAAQLWRNNTYFYTFKGPTYFLNIAFDF